MIFVFVQTNGDCSVGLRQVHIAAKRGSWIKRGKRKTLENKILQWCLGRGLLQVDWVVEGEAKNSQ